MAGMNQYLANGSNRGLAYLADLAAAGCVMMVLNAIGESAGSALSEWHYFALVLFGYHAYFLIWKNGVSFGKFLRGICVVSVNGESLSILQSILRAALISAPYTWLSTSEIGPSVVRGQMPPILSVLSIAALWWWLADVFLVETLDGRRTLTDRVAKTMVVNLPPLQPHRAPAVPMYSANDAEFGSKPRRPK